MARCIKLQMQMPPIMYGTAWKKERTEELVVQAVLHGFRGRVFVIPTETDAGQG